MDVSNHSKDGNVMRKPGLALAVVALSVLALSTPAVANEPLASNAEVSKGSHCWAQASATPQASPRPRCFSTAALMATDFYGVKFPDGTTLGDLDSYERERQRLVFSRADGAATTTTMLSADASLTNRRIFLPESGVAVPMSLVNPGLGRWYTGVNRTGSTLLLRNSDAGPPCNNLQYAVLYSPWNNNLESQEVYPSCTSTRQWDSQSYSGATYLASGWVNSFGSFNNVAGSMRIQSAG